MTSLHKSYIWLLQLQLFSTAVLAVSVGVLALELSRHMNAPRVDLIPIDQGKVITTPSGAH